MLRTVGCLSVTTLISMRGVRPSVFLHIVEQGMHVPGPQPGLCTGCTLLIFPLPIFNSGTQPGMRISVNPSLEIDTGGERRLILPPGF